MKRKFWNWVRNEGEKRVLLLDGEISDETWWGDEVTPQMFRSDLNAAEGDIDLWINSPGGDCYAAAQIYNMLMEYKGNVAVKIDGIAASAASVVAMAGSTVEISPLGMLMIHNPMTVSIGDTHEMERTITFLAEIKESIINAYEIKTGLSRLDLTADGCRDVDERKESGRTWICGFRSLCGRSASCDGYGRRADLLPCRRHELPALEIRAGNTIKHCRCRASEKTALFYFTLTEG